MSRPATTPALAVADLRCALAVLRVVGSDEVARLADGIERYLTEAPQGVSLDRCLGLIALPGSRPWWTVEARARRDAAVMRVASAHFADLSLSAAGKEIARAMKNHRMPLDDSETARRAAAKRPSARRQLSELVGSESGIPDHRHLRRVLREASGVGHELGEVMANRSCYDDSHEPEKR